MGEGESTVEEGAEQPKPKRESGVSSIVGIEPEQVAEVMAKYKKAFEGHSGKTLETKPIELFERDKTSEEVETMGTILGNIKPFVEHYQGVPVDVTLSHIHMLEKHKLDERTKKLTAEQDGFYEPEQQFIAIFDSGNNLKNAQLLVHELLHFNSFHTLEKTHTGVKIGYSGFERSHYNQKGIRDAMYFNEINEAMVEELVKRFDKQYFRSIPHISEKVNARDQLIAQKLITNPEDKDTLEYISLFEVKDSGFGMARVEGHAARFKERKALNELLVAIYGKNKDRFASPEDVFYIFATAFMTGDFSEVQKLVEKTDGKGSFKRLGERTKKR